MRKMLNLLCINFYMVFIIFKLNVLAFVLLVFEYCFNVQDPLSMVL